MGRIIICGDIHSSYKALKQCLERSSFDYENDTLIQLGDICDGWNETYECIEELLKIKNKILIIGNHDQWFKEWLVTGVNPVSWMQGGEGTLKSYCDNLDKYYEPKFSGYSTNLNPVDIPQSHKDLFNSQIPYYKDENDNIFVHGGFNIHYLLNDQRDNEIFWWDRDLWMQALSVKSAIGFEGMSKPTLKIKEPCNEIFIGHTTTINWGTTLPMTAANITNLDTGCGFKGVLTFVDLNTDQIWQSDNVTELHKDWKGR